MKDKELPDSAALIIIVLLVLGTLSYFVYDQWERMQSINNQAAAINVEAVALKMDKERQDYRAVMEGKKTLAEIDAPDNELPDPQTDASGQTGEQPASQAATPAAQKATPEPAKPAAAKPEINQPAVVSQPAPEVKTPPAAKPAVEQPAKSATIADTLNTYSCDQKLSCSQMKSCAEAKFYAKQCSNSKIVPDQNGHVCPDLCATNPIN